ncbi:MAG: ankyrin repeat domain-containing protein [Lentisphaerae bacterium]|nr:ankyrin repeat domain-containing protein [Lentisphaerota bacterium]
MGEAYIWRRQFSLDRMETICGIQRMNSFLPETLRQASAFARCKLTDPGMDCRLYTSFDGVWNGVPAHFTLEARPLFYDIAFKAYAKAIAEVAEYYPGFAETEVTDGPLAGERRLSFPKALDEAASYWLSLRFWTIVEDGEVTAREHVEVAPDPEGCRVGGRLRAVVTAVLDREETTEAALGEIAAVIATGRPFPVSDEEKHGNPRLTARMLTEVSLPELVLLNWDAVCKPASDHDKALFAAIREFDFEGVRRALESGADPNCVAFGDTPLYEVCMFQWCERFPCRDEAEYEENRRNHPGPSSSEKIRMVDLLVGHGASVNWAAPNEETPLCAACQLCDRELILHLADLGADPSIRHYLDDCQSKWGGAWEWAHYMCNPAVDHDDETAWHALCERFKAPFGGFPERKRA